MEIILKPIAFVKNQRKQISDDYWGTVVSEIELVEEIPAEAFENIEMFSHLEIIFYFDKVQSIMYTGRPRGNPQYPLMGIFAQRKKDRPNQIGLTTVELIEHNDRAITVKGLDAIDGTPVIDIKPVFKEFAAKKQTRQPEWVEDLMKHYWH
jgi:tRNA-Thr(GGU) m(6)t(6)A37 methyltransferase TsaA